MAWNAIPPKYEPSLSYLASPIAEYFYAAPPYNNVTLEALIFTPPPQPPRLLLLQATCLPDPNAFSACWQLPRGKPIFSDPSLIGALTRIVLQQTGLQLSYVAAMLGSETGPATPQSGNMRWMKMTFLVEVADLGPSATAIFDGSMVSTPEDSAGSDYSDRCEEGQPPSNNSKVCIEPSLHSQYLWVSENELQEFVKAGLYPVEERISYQVMLEAFAFYRQDFAYLEYLRQSRDVAGS